MQFACPNWVCMREVVPQMDYLVDGAMASVVLSKNFFVPVRVLTAARFAVHKMFSAFSRVNQKAKTDKDLRQATVLIGAVESRYPGDIADAMQALPVEGRERMLRGYLACWVNKIG